MKSSESTVEQAPQALGGEGIAQFKKIFRTQDESLEKLSPPSGFCFTQTGNLLLADDFNHRVQIYDPEHNLIKSFGSKGKSPGELHYPRGIAVDAQENIYVADSWNHRVQKFDADGNPLLTIGSCGGGKGELNEPYDVFIDPHENILIVERYNHRIQMFDPEGRSKGWVGGRGTVLEEELAHIFETPKNLFNSPAFEFPTSIARDRHGNYFISDSGNHRIVKFDPQWNLLLTFGQRGNEPGQFEYPLCVSVAPNNLLYVADLNNDRVQIFTLTGLYLDQLKQAKDSGSLSAPCLTAVASSGTLYVGLTFDTRVMTFDIPDKPQQDWLAGKSRENAKAPYIFYHRALEWEHIEDKENALRSSQEAMRQITKESSPPDASQNFALDLLVQFSRLALNEEDPEIESLLLKSFAVLTRHLDAERQRVLATYEEWEDAAVRHNRQLFTEQQKILEDREDPRVFNRDLFQAEIRDRTLFRQLRHRFYEYRTAVEQGSEFFGNVINLNLSDAGLSTCLNIAETRIDQICKHVIGFLETKEKNENAMVESFGEMQGPEGKWETFLVRSNTNARIMDVLRQFHFEIRSLLANFKGAALKFPEHAEVEKTLKRQFIDPQGSEKFLKILLGFQEEWQFHQSLEVSLKDLMDLWMNRWAGPDDNAPRELKAVDFKPVPFDAEELLADAMAEPLLVEGMPVKKTNAGLACGHLLFSEEFFSQNEEGHIKLLQELLENEQVYDSKYNEALQQLQALSQQKKELETKLNRVNPQDKKSPITLQNSIAVVTFQVSLIRRMILTMEINEANNLFRLVMGASLWINSEKSHRSPGLANFIKTVQTFQSDLTQKIDQGLEEKKTLAFEASRLNGLLSAIEENNEIVEINKTLEIKDQVARIQPRDENLAATLNRWFKIRNRICKLLDFDEASQANSESRLESASGLSLKFSFANSGPITRHLLQPYGMAQTPEGDFVLADYENHQVVRYSSQGIYKNHFGGWGNSPGFFKYPVMVAVDRQGFLYVADEKNSRVQKFTPDGKFLLSFGDREADEQRLGPIFSLSIDGQDQIWVADPSHNRVQIYSSDGSLLRSIQNESLSEPVSVCCLENGDFLIGDKSPHLLKQFDAAGKMIRGIKKEGLGFGEIYFMTCHPDRGIFATDYWNHQILHLNSQLEVISVLKNPGKRAGQFGKVGGLIASGRELVVADFENFRVQVLEIPKLRNGS
ncbi:MAG: hypothetical protein NPINA01_24450 [Nitrospinaceae bacterium]|nr:MAG: hypothetical protein NPINA01_24450 [Nitrospinaceae bacterium]